MAKMLCRELTVAEQLVLASLVQHPGFEILTRMFNDYCVTAAAEPYKINPTDPRYDELLKISVLTGRIANDVVDSLRKSVNTHIASAVERQHQQEEDERIDRETEHLMGSIRLLAQQDNEQSQGVRE